jgi:ribonuclease BN (tRNA processing enzyme)
MKLRVLGCSGGIAATHKTTSLLIDSDLLIDAGTGVNDLSLDEMACLRHLFLTHSHLDHVACLPLLLDSVFDRMQHPLVVHGLKETLAALRTHIFNDIIWPDFGRLPNPQAPILTYAELQPGERIVLGDREITPLRVNHAVPAVGYHVASPTGSFVFSGDTTTNDTLWNALNELPPPDILIIEAAFTDENRQLSIESRHYCPALLADDLRKLVHTPPLYLTHPKPGDEDAIFTQCQRQLQGFALHRLCQGDSFDL